MKAWLTRLFGSTALPSPPAAATAAPGAVAPGAAAPAQDVPAPPTASGGAQVSEVFFHWLAGDDAGAAQPQLEATILDALARLAAAPDAGASLVPRVPAVLPQLLRSLRDDSISGADLARQLAQDVVLVAEVIREANSPYYRPAAPVRTIEGAVMLLGQNGMRMLLARVSFRPIISQQSGHFARLLAPQVWRQSELCAQAASLLAPAMGANPFEAYLAGLMENVGLMVALRLIDQIHAGPALPQSAQFCSALYEHARDMSARIANLWDFPAAVSSAIRAAGADSADPLARTLAASTRVSKLRMLVDAGRFAPDDAFVAASLDPATRTCFEQLHNEEDT